jgi:hypothetical protein
LTKLASLTGGLVASGDVVAAVDGDAVVVLPAQVALAYALLALQARNCNVIKVRCEANLLVRVSGSDAASKPLETTYSLAVRLSTCISLAAQVMVSS